MRKRNVVKLNIGTKKCLPVKRVVVMVMMLYVGVMSSVRFCRRRWWYVFVEEDIYPQGESLGEMIARANKVVP